MRSCGHCRAGSRPSCLLLVLDHGELDLGVLQRRPSPGPPRPGTSSPGCRPGMANRHRPVQPRAVVAHHREAVAALEAKLRQPRRSRARFRPLAPRYGSARCRIPSRASPAAGGAPWRGASASAEGVRPCSACPGSDALVVCHATLLFGLVLSVSAPRAPGAFCQGPGGNANASVPVQAGCGKATFTAQLFVECAELLQAACVPAAGPQTGNAKPYCDLPACRPIRA